MQQRQGMPQQGQMPSMMQGMQQGRGVPSQISDLYGGQRQGMPQQGMQRMDPAMQQQYQRQLEQSMQQPQSRGMPQQGRGVPSQISDLYGGQRQGMQGMSAAQGMNPDRQVSYFPGTPPEMRQQQQPQQRGTLTAADEQMFPGISNASNQAPARFRKGGEAKKKAAAQGRMAKPAGRGRTTKPAVRGRMAKPTRGKK
jgi:hypothetical protein